MTLGKVKWFNNQKGYGFILLEDGREVFAHYTNIESEGYKTLAENQTVEFDLEDSERGLAAKHIKVV